MDTPKCTVVHTQIAHCAQFIPQFCTVAILQLIGLVLTQVQDNGLGLSCACSPFLLWLLYKWLRLECGCWITGALPELLSDKNSPWQRKASAVILRFFFIGETVAHKESQIAFPRQQENQCQRIQIFKTRVVLTGNTDIFLLQPLPHTFHADIPCLSHMYTMFHAGIPCL